MPFSFTYDHGIFFYRNTPNKPHTIYILDKEARKVIKIISLNNNIKNNTMGKTNKRIIEDELLDLELDLHIIMITFHVYDEQEKVFIYKRINEITERIAEIKESLITKNK